MELKETKFFHLASPFIFKSSCLDFYMYWQTTFIGCIFSMKFEMRTICGMTEDENSTRREVVRRKTARYLMKAEELFHSHLAEDSATTHTEQQRWDVSDTFFPYK